MGSISKKIRKIRKSLNEARILAENGTQTSDPDHLEQVLNSLLAKEEIYWRQRSRVNWLIAGDRNTAFFHKSATARCKRNLILGLFDETNCFKTNQKEMEGIVTSFYSDFFSSQRPDPREIQTIMGLIPRTIPHNLLDSLNTPFSKEEVHKALSDLNASKAPGPDGLTAHFFQNAWDTIGRQMSNVILGVLNNGESLKTWNDTIVTLIPKVKEPTNVRQFRPISLCNIKYKIVARATTNRLKGVMSSIIDQNQSAFIPGRIIMDNVILGFECMH